MVPKPDSLQLEPVGEVGVWALRSVLRKDSNCCCNHLNHSFFCVPCRAGPQERSSNRKRSVLWCTNSEAVKLPGQNLSLLPLTLNIWLAKVLDMRCFSLKWHVANEQQAEGCRVLQCSEDTDVPSLLTGRQPDLATGCLGRWDSFLPLW